MKNDRQNQLLQIINEECIETQEQLLARLQERGIKCTQATISRDIKEMHLIKEPAGQGKYRYAVSAHRTKLNFADKLRTIFHESIVTLKELFLLCAVNIREDNVIQNGKGQTAGKQYEACFQQPLYSAVHLNENAVFLIVSEQFHIR